MVLGAAAVVVLALAATQFRPIDLLFPPPLSGRALSSALERALSAPMAEPARPGLEAKVNLHDGILGIERNLRGACDRDERAPRSGSRKATYVSVDLREVDRIELQDGRGEGRPSSIRLVRTPEAALAHQEAERAFRAALDGAPEGRAAPRLMQEAGWAWRARLKELGVSSWSAAFDCTDRLHVALVGTREVALVSHDPSLPDIHRGLEAVHDGLR